MSRDSPQAARREERAAERRSLRQPARTRLGTACGLLAIIAAAAAVITTRASIAAIANRYGVAPLRPGGAAGQVSPLLLTYLIGGGLGVGGALMLAPKTAGWWLTFACAALGPLDLFRIYRRLVAALNFDHPDVNKVILNLAISAGFPALCYAGLFTLLLQRRLRASYRI